MISPTILEKDKVMGEPSAKAQLFTFILVKASISLKRSSGELPPMCCMICQGSGT